MILLIECDAGQKMMSILPSIISISVVFAGRPCLSDTNLKPPVCARGTKGSQVLPFPLFSLRCPFKNLFLLQRLLLEMLMVLLLSVFMEVKLSVEVISDAAKVFLQILLTSPSSRRNYPCLFRSPCYIGHLSTT